MARNGSGVYTPPAASYPAVSGTLIESVKFNAVIDDMSTAISESVPIDGQRAMTGNLPMGAHKITGLADGTNASDACAYGQAGSAAIAATYAATGKTTPVDADVLPLSDSAASFGLKKLTWANLKATLAATFAAKGANSDITSLSGLTTPLTVAQGGTGAATHTANNVLIGAGTSAVTSVAPGTAGNVLTSQAGVWASAAPASTGKVAQVVSATVTSLASLTTVMPLDDTIPQKTEGDQVLTVNITPTSATSTLFIEVSVVAGIGAAAVIACAAIFRDTTAGAIAAVVEEIGGIANSATTISFQCSVAATAATLTTFNVRVGPSSAGTLYLNGANTARIFGGVSTSMIKVTEVLA